MPAEWTRKQTLTGSERYITEELKELETKILTAQEKILEIEVRLYNELVVSLADYIPIIQNNARLAARLDVLNAFAYCAVQYQYTKPIISNFQSIDIKDGRHPVIERQLPPEEPYIANDIYLDTDKQQIIVITGPNMSGKSALLRQTALITLMAQMGCYVPARECTIGIVDKIFTRVGASDNISTGESTFMVEMNETANILNNVTNRSLVLLDEIGRGTSTYDGISIAWSIAEYLHENPLHHAKVLFATHYHELNDMAAQFPRIKNYHVSVKELDNKVYFLRKLEEGGSEHSFGIHVARMAGMPPAVLRRAEEILKQLEESRARREEKGEEVHIEKPKDDSYQLSFINLDDPLLLEVKETIVGLDINSLTPVEALMKLNEIHLYNLSFPNNFPTAMNGDPPEFGLVGKISGTRYSGDDVADTGVRDVRGSDFQKLRVNRAGTDTDQCHLIRFAVHQLHIARALVPQLYPFCRDILHFNVPRAFIVKNQFFGGDAHQVHQNITRPYIVDNQ